LLVKVVNLRLDQLLQVDVARLERRSSPALALRIATCDLLPAELEAARGLLLFAACASAALVLA
jgi:hypothetical protein